MLYSVQFNKEKIEKKDINERKSRLNNIESLSLDSLKEKMRAKETVKVVSCYYGIDILNNFLKAMTGRGRTTDVILCAAGASKESWIVQMEQLMKEVKLGQNQNVYLYTKFSLLHSKIYLSVCKRYEKKSAYGATCLVGSANLSENAFKCNEEVLVEVSDDNTKRSINNYVTEILDNKNQKGNKRYLHSVRDLINKKRKEKKKFKLESEFKEGADKNDTLLKYILSGFLFFKAPRNFSLGFGDDDWRKDIKSTSDSEYIKDSKSLDVAAVLRVKGYDEIDERIDSSEIGEGKKKKKNKVSIAANSIETCFGYWVPASKKDKLIVQIYGKDNENLQRKNDYADIIKALRDNCECLNNDVKDRLKEAFKAVNLQKEKYETYEDKIIKHIESKKRYYEKNEKNYLNNGFCITPMPNIFEDLVASTEFLDSLWDSICVKSNRQKASKKTDSLAKILYSQFVGENGDILKLSDRINKLSL